MACLAGVLIMVAYNMSGWRTVLDLFKGPKSDVSVLVVTFLLTVIFDLTIAIEIGLLLAVFLFIKRVMENTQIKVLSQQIDIADGTESTQHEVLKVADGVEIYEIDGPFFFGVATKFNEVMCDMADSPQVRIIRMRKVPFIDSTGIYNLESLIRSSKSQGIQIVLSGVNPNVKKVLLNAGINEIIGDQFICENITQAVKTANSLIENKKSIKEIKWN